MARRAGPPPGGAGLVPGALAGAVEGDVFIGPKARELRGLLKINYPLEHGIVTDWDDMERIWQYVYNDELKIVPEDVRFYSECCVSQC